MERLGSRGRGGSGRGRSSGGYDPLTCYWWKVHGHLARYCLGMGSQLLTGGSSGPTQGSSLNSGQSDPICGRGRERHVCFGGMNVLYDSKGCEYLVDDYGQVYVPFETKQIDAKMTNEEKVEETKN